MKLATKSAFLLALCGCAGASGPPPALSADPELMAVLGNAAGDPLTCVGMQDLGPSRLFPVSQAIVFEGRGARLYLNQPAEGCPVIRRDLSLRLASTAGRLCDGDVVRFVDGASGEGAGTCNLGAFRPYAGNR